MAPRKVVYRVGHTLRGTQTAELERPPRVAHDLGLATLDRAADRRGNLQSRCFLQLVFRMKRDFASPLGLMCTILVNVQKPRLSQALRGFNLKSVRLRTVSGQNCQEKRSQAPHQTRSQNDRIQQQYVEPDSARKIIITITKETARINTPPPRNYLAGKQTSQTHTGSA